MDDYRVEEREDKSFCLFVSGKAAQTAGKGTDMEAVLERYISIGKSEMRSSEAVQMDK